MSLSGEGYLSVILIAIHLSEYADGVKALVIDEPELSLHPQAQKRLAKLLAEKAKTRQIIICTHSPYFVRWEDYINGAHFVRLSKNKKRCIIKWISANAHGENEWKPVGFTDVKKPHQWDAVAKEIMFSEKVLFVEGQEDVGYIKKYFEGTCDFDIFGYGVGGCGNFKHYLELAKKLGIEKCAVLFDNCYCKGKHTKHCETSQLEKLQTSFPNVKYVQLKTHDIRDKEERSDEAVPGTFDEKHKLKTDQKVHFEAIMAKLKNHFE